MNINEIINMACGLPKSVYYNIKLFGVSRGCQLPILFGRKTKLEYTKMCKILLPDKCGFGTVKIGVNYGPFRKGIRQQTILSMHGDTTLVFRGKCNINSGSTMNFSSGKCVFGNNFAANSGFLLSCEKNIEFGDNVLFGWDCTVIDGDGHDIIDTANNVKVNPPQKIIVGDHVWCAAHSSILKGSTIESDCVVGYGSIVAGKHTEAYSVITGIPAKAIKKNVTWIR